MTVRLAGTSRVCVLVSARNEREALDAASAGADYIDLKDPSQGALGGLGPAVCGRIVAALRSAGSTVPVSATIGDPDPAGGAGPVLHRIVQTAAAGVDLVKVGLLAGAHGRALLPVLAGVGMPVVPVLLVDAGFDAELAQRALEADTFAAVMLDTSAKGDGGLLARVPMPALQDFVGSARKMGRACGLAGALSFADLALLRQLRPDFAGFRSAVCPGGRASALDPGRVRELCRWSLATSSGTGSLAPRDHGLIDASQVGLHQ